MARTTHMRFRGLKVKMIWSFFLVLVWGSGCRLLYGYRRSLVLRFRVSMPYLGTTWTLNEVKFQSYYHFGASEYTGTHNPKIAQNHKTLNPYKL